VGRIARSWEFLVREFVLGLVNPAKDPFFHGDRGVFYIEKNGRHLYARKWRNDLYLRAHARTLSPRGGVSPGWSLRSWRGMTATQLQRSRVKRPELKRET